MRAGARWAHIRGRDRLGMPGHRARNARHVEAHAELPSGQPRLGRVLDVRQFHRIAVRQHAGSDGYALLAVIEGHRPVGSRNDVRATSLHPNKESVEGDWLGAERVREPEAYACSPEIRSDDEPERLIA